MVNINTGTVTIPTGLAVAMKKEALIVLNGLAEGGGLDIDDPFVPSLTPSTWSNAELYHYFAWSDKGLTSLIKDDQSKNDAAVIAAQVTAEADVAVFDAARTTHSSSSLAVKTARDAARDAVDTDIKSGVSFS